MTLARTPLPRGTPLRRTSGPARRTEIRPVSAKRQRTNRERRRNLHAAYGTDPACVARLDGCHGHASDGHEVLSRGRGGSITDPANVVPLCRPCHTFVTEHPDWAETHGWALPSWGGDAA